MIHEYIFEHAIVIHDSVDLPYIVVERRNYGKGNEDETASSASFLGGDCVVPWD